MEMNNVDKARCSFEDSFANSPDFYNRQTNDKQHLESIMNAVKIKHTDTVLDLGTGNGYLAFAFAKAHPSASVIGLDIVVNALKMNGDKAQADGVNNLNFLSYNGVYFPLGNNTFDWVVTRYAMHHFPDVQISFNEIARILKPGGKLFIADPIPNALDYERFVDKYMQLKNDGHNRFYTLDEFEDYARSAGLTLASSFLTGIHFPRKVDERYYRLLDHTPHAVKQLYQIEIQTDECYIFEEVQNMVFSKV